MSGVVAGLAFGLGSCGAWCRQLCNRGVGFIGLFYVLFMVIYCALYPRFYQALKAYFIVHCIVCSESGILSGPKGSFGVTVSAVQLLKLVPVTLRDFPFA